ncbi:MAG TPA: hypothetical protein VJ654_14265 [Noviherbaspirillum sp.]|nr:hypothetical protein [Noviherbaspirillum sp.]
MKISCTTEELCEFDRLIDMAESENQLDRIAGRIDLRKFVAKHGKEKCDAMFAHLEAEAGRAKA